MSTKFVPLTTRPASTSRQGMTRLRCTWPRLVPRSPAAREGARVGCLPVRGALARASTSNRLSRDCGLTRRRRSASRRGASARGLRRLVACTACDTAPKRSRRGGHRARSSSHAPRPAAPLDPPDAAPAERRHPRQLTRRIDAVVRHARRRSHGASALDVRARLRAARARPPRGRARQRGVPSATVNRARRAPCRRSRRRG